MTCVCDLNCRPLDNLLPLDWKVTLQTGATVLAGELSLAAQAMRLLMRLYSDLRDAHVHWNDQISTCHACSSTGYHDDGIG